MAERPPGTAHGGRLPVVDHLKAAAIVAVVFTHSGAVLFRPGVTAWDRWLTGSWIWFHVPTFLLISGFLYCRTSGVAVAEIGRRLARLWVPMLVSSAIILALGVARVKDPADALFRLASGSILGHYYFVPVLTGCILLCWPLSRARPRAAWLTLAGLLAYALACALRPGWKLTRDPFWAARSPLESFFLGYFVIGWLAALYWDRLSAFVCRNRTALVCACAACVVLWFAGLGGRFPVRWVVLNRAAYTLGVAGIALAVLGEREPPRAVRFLSETTLAIFLYHSAFQLVAYGLVASWSPPLRILFQVGLGLGGGCLIALAARRLLGPRQARRWFGA